MRIAVFHNLPAGGAKRALYEHAWRLRERGHTLHGYTLSNASAEYLPLEEVCDQVYRYDLHTPDGRRARALQRLLAPQRLWRLFDPHLRALLEDQLIVHRLHLQLDSVERLYTRVAADIEERGYDVVYVHHCQFSLSPPLLRLLRTPSVYYAQDTLRLAYEWSLTEQPNYDSCRSTFYMRHHRGQTYTLPQLGLLQRRERECALNTRAASAVLCNSWYSREALVRTTGTNPRVCYLGVDAQFFHPDPRVAREPVVLSVGALLPHKGHQSILEAVATLPRSRRPRLRILGYELEGGRKTLGPMARSLLSLAEQYGVRLEIEKEVSDERLRDAYRSAQVAAFAPHLEPFGLVPLEAMACKTPVVGVSEGGLRESIQDGVTGLLAGRDPQELGAAIDRLLTDPAFARRIAANGHEAVRERWTWERSVDELERWLERVAGREATAGELALA